LVQPGGDRIDTPVKEITMNHWNQLLAAPDATLGFPNQTSSTFKQVGQSYDQKTAEHVILLEYRVKVAPGLNEVREEPIFG
jgi:hypothetical protein